MNRLLAYIQTKSDAVGEVAWEISIDISVVRTHQHVEEPEAGVPGIGRGALTEPERPEYQAETGL